MNASLITSLAALAISVAAIIIVLQFHSVTVSDKHFQEQLQIALAKRERETVQHLLPRMTMLYDEMHAGKDYFDGEPETFAELFKPLFEIIQEMTDR